MANTFLTCRPSVTVKVLTNLVGPVDLLQCNPELWELIPNWQGHSASVGLFQTTNCQVIRCAYPSTS